MQPFQLRNFLRGRGQHPQGDPDRRAGVDLIRDGGCAAVVTGIGWVLVVPEVEVRDLDVGVKASERGEAGFGRGSPQDDDHVFGGGAASHFWE